jgi:hypothetical protein
MYRSLILSLIIFQSILLFSCGQDEEKRVMIHDYYDVEKIISLQIKKLDSLNPLVQKTVQVDNNIEKESLRLRNVWERELEIFRIAEINKPVFKGRYKKSVTKEQSLHSITYKPLENPILGIDYLKIWYEDVEENLRKIEVAYSEENLLYKSERVLVMNFKNVDSKKILMDSYSITGSQKMIFRSQRKFRVDADIL